MSENENEGGGGRVRQRRKEAKRRRSGGKKETNGGDATCIFVEDRPCFNTKTALTSRPRSPSR